MNRTKDFRFGLETEYLIADAKLYNPYWYKDITFAALNALLESIPLTKIPSLAGLELEAPHQKLMPFVVEGYHLPDMDWRAVDILPKGIEIRTPVCSTIDECLAVHKILFDRLKKGLATMGLVPIALSHHPVETDFAAQQNNRRRDFWQWAMAVMTTYGPDINIGIPGEIMSFLDINDLHAKVNYYSPAMTVFSLSSPFSGGKLWEIRGTIGKSLRTYRRSIVAPAMEIHPQENNRLEFKDFEMSCKTSDYNNYFLLFLTLLLDPELKGRAASPTRIYDLGAIAVDSWAVTGIKEKAIELLQSAQRTLPQWGFDSTPLASFHDLLDQKRTPADDLIDYYLNHHSNLPSVLRHLQNLT